MSTEDTLRFGKTPFGSLAIDPTPQAFKAERTADGFILTLSGTLRIQRLKLPRTAGFDMCMFDLAASLVGPSEPGGVEFASGTCRGFFYEAQQNINLRFRGTFDGLAAYEKLRAGRPPVLELHWDASAARLRGPRGEPYDMRRIEGLIVLQPANEAWTTMLDSIGAGTNVCVEIPLLPRPPQPWDEVWKALEEARRCFRGGGPDAWKNTIAAARRGLEVWRDMEPCDTGLAWKKPTPQELQARTKAQRLDGLRWHLHQLAHLAPHSAAEEWTREDAALVLATLSGLLAERQRRG